MKLNRWLAGVLILQFTGILNAQTPRIRFEHFSIEDGLSQNTVRSILQDHQGFMWFGTDDGLNKFDGYRFTHYKNHLGDANSLSNNNINVIYEDRSGTLWVGTNGGLNRFDRRTETFQHFRHDSQNPKSLNDNVVSAIYEDHAGTLWIGTQQGLNKLDPGGTTFTQYQHTFGEYHVPWMRWVQAIGEYVSEEGSTLFVGSWGAGLLRFDRKTETFSQCLLPDVDPMLQHRRWISAIHVDHAGDVWVADAEIHKYDPKTGVFHTVYSTGFTDSKGHAHRVYKSASEKLILGTGENGLVMLDPGLKHSTSVRNDVNDPGSLGDDMIEAIYEDAAGDIWIGTERGGVSKFEPAKKKFASYHYNLQNRSRFSEDNIVATLSTNSGAILIVVRTTGLHVFDQLNKTFTPYQHDFRGGLQIGQVLARTVYQDNSGRIWFGTWGLGVYLYSSDDPDSGLLQHYIETPDEPESLIDNYVGAITESREGELWIGTLLGVTVMGLEDMASGKFKHYRHDPEDSTSLGDMRADIIFQDGAGQIWIGSNSGGLSLFERQSDSFIRYKHNPYDVNSLSSDRVLSIFQDSRDRLWVGTEAGLDRFDPASQTFIHYTEADGLPNPEINGVVEDTNGNLWISTNNGISKFDPDNGTFKNYDVYDGLLSLETRTISNNETTGEMFVGGPLGLTVFHPDEVMDNPYVPPVAITSLKRYRVDQEQTTEIEERGINMRDQIELSHKNTILNFELAALSFRNAKKNQYSYMLEGFNDNWIQLGKRREITFTNLDPGEYVLRVKGSNNDGVWNEAGTSLKIIILPPWWQTWWAYTLYGLSILGILYGLRCYELNRQQWKHGMELERVESEKLKELDSLKSRFFANISHEFRTPLTLILGPLENLRSGRFKGDLTNQYGMMQRNARRLLRLINQLLDLSKLEAGKLRLETSCCNLVPLMKGLVYSFESLADRKNIALQFEADPDEIMVYLDRDKMENIIANLLSNAFKFTPEGGRISIGVSIAGNKAVQSNADTFTIKFVQITISDTGSGIHSRNLPHIFERFYQAGNSYQKDQQGSGIGLALTKELVELHKGEIQVKSEVGIGTEFMIYFRLGKDHLKQKEIIESDTHIDDRDALGLKLDQPSESEPFSDVPPNSSSLAVSSSLVEQTKNGEENSIILIVEDNPDMRAYINEQLSDSYQVVEAEDGREGLEKSIELIPDLVISDVMMPKIDGYQLCEKIKTEECTSHIPVILLTAKSSGDSKVEGLQLGADDYLIKPFDSHELRVRVKNLIEQRRKLRKRFGKEIKLQPKDIAITSADEKFLQRVMVIIDQHLSDEGFTVEQFGREIGLSRSQLHRKLKGLTDQPPVEFIRTIRLKRAAQLLEQGYGTIAEVAYEVGFSDASYFTRCFRQQFGILPSDYAANGSRQGT